jgi:hypothetical protein
MRGSQMWISPDGVARWTRGLLLAGAALSAVALVSDLMEVGLISRAATAAVTEAEAAANDSRQQLIGVLQVGVYLGTIVAFLMWFHRSHRNLSALGNDDLKYTPGWAIGGFFVPVLNLVRPVQVMREIWYGSAPSGYHRDTALDDHAARNALPTPFLVGLWWALFLITGFLGQVVFRMTLDEEATLAELKTTSQLQAVADLIDVPTALVLFVLVGRIASWQSERYDLASTQDLMRPGPGSGVPASI